MSLTYSRRNYKDLLPLTNSIQLKEISSLQKQCSQETSLLNSNTEAASSIQDLPQLHENHSQLIGASGISLF